MDNNVHYRKVEFNKSKKEKKFSKWRVKQKVFKSVRLFVYFSLVPLFWIKSYYSILFLYPLMEIRSQLQGLQAEIIPLIKFVKDWWNVGQIIYMLQFLWWTEYFSLQNCQTPDSLHWPAFLKLFKIPSRKVHLFDSFFPAEYKYVNHFFPSTSRFPEILCQRSKNHPK